MSKVNSDGHNIKYPFNDIVYETQIKKNVHTETITARSPHHVVAIDSKGVYDICTPKNV